MIRTESVRGRIALMVAHCAGMVDLVALPVWVGTLISVYRFDPQQALWRKEALPFQLQMFHRGFLFKPRIERIEAGGHGLGGGNRRLA